MEKAMGLNQEAALQSTSWGIGQLMGFNYKVAGFTNVNDMVAAMVNDENAQILAMADFIKGNLLDGALQKQDWAAFAKGYNGTDYQKNNYDTKLEVAHAKNTQWFFRICLFVRRRRGYYTLVIIPELSMAFAENTRVQHYSNSRNNLVCL